jgi:Holliday junction resolvase-like predicted endonuclease
MKTFCSKQCRLRRDKQAHHELNPYVKLCSTGKIGAMSEMLVCVDLMKRGFEIFRAVSQCCSCDLIALRGGKALRVEVKTGYRTKSGDCVKSLRKKAAQSPHDLLAAVWLDNHEIKYHPTID